MRITLVHPAGFNFVPGQPDFSVLANRMMPIGILTLAAWLEKHGHPTAVHDCLGPCAPGLETSGASIGQDDVREAMTWPGIIGLGEMMNFPGVLASDARMHGEMAETVKARKTVGGHYAALDLGTPFHSYVAGGPEDDHEGTRLEDAVARVRQGMKVMLRFGSAWYDQ